MKNTFHALLACATLATAGVALSTGCSSTPTRESTGEYVDDSAVTAKVKSSYVGDKLVSALDIKVETYKGVVQLSGFVNTSDQKRRAEDLARGVAGVKSVENRITVKSQ